jgi:hypothetical protein
MRSCGATSISGRYEVPLNVPLSWEFTGNKAFYLTGRIRNGHAPDRSVICRHQSTRFRLDYDPEKHPSSARGLFSTPEDENDIYELPYSGLSPKPKAFWREKLPSEVRVWNKHAHRARMISLPIKEDNHSIGNLFPASEYYHVDIERNYSAELPSISIVEGKLLLNKGFLQPWDDPDVPYHFFYR